METVKVYASFEQTKSMKECVKHLFPKLVEIVQITHNKRDLHTVELKVKNAEIALKFGLTVGIYNA